MENFYCSICTNTFDGASHRPRAMPCGHGSCTQCIEKYIRGGCKACPLCGKDHGANSAADLPVSFLLEEMLHRASISASQKHESESAKAENSGGICPKHNEIPLYFHCKSHNIKVCHSCAVIDHPITSCNLISLKDHIKENKQIQITTVQKQKQIFIDTENELTNLLQFNNDFLIEQRNKIEQINQEIVKKEKSQEKIKDAIQVCQAKQATFHMMGIKLSAATNNQDIARQCEMAKTEILQSQYWEDTLRKVLNMDKVSVGEDIYAQVKRNGIHRSCKVIPESGKTLIPSLSNEVKPPSSATLIKEGELGLMNATSTVFLDLSARGHSLGRVYIRVLGNRPFGREFLDVVLGIDNGLQLKGNTFQPKMWRGYITLFQFVTHQSEPKLNHPMFKNPKDKHYKKQARGWLSKWFTTHTSEFRLMNSCYINDHRYFGDVNSGMEVIDRASNEYDSKDITISECGIVL